MSHPEASCTKYTKEVKNSPLSRGNCTKLKRRYYRHKTDLAFDKDGSGLTNTAEGHNESDTNKKYCGSGNLNNSEVQKDEVRSRTGEMKNESEFLTSLPDCLVSQSAEDCQKPKHSSSNQHEKTTAVLNYHKPVSYIQRKTNSHVSRDNNSKTVKVFETVSSHSRDTEDVEIKEEFHSRGIYTFENPRQTAHEIADSYILIEKWQCELLRKVPLPDKVAYVYNPLEYAFETHYNFIVKFCNSEKHILFLGMNPGPWGMSQNGVPFGETSIVKDWLGIEGCVLKPEKEHPKRPILGLNCKRSEVSGSRFWGFFKTICKTPENFFKTCFVYNMCPMAFMTETGKNVTPPQLTAKTLHHVNSVCDEALLKVVKLLNVKVVVGVGKYAYTRAVGAMKSSSMTGVSVDTVMHPSPINPAANKGWDKIVSQQLEEKGLLAVIKNNVQS